MQNFGAFNKSWKGLDEDEKGNIIWGEKWNNAYKEMYVYDDPNVIRKRLYNRLNTGSTRRVGGKKKLTKKRRRTKRRTRHTKKQKHIKKRLIKRRR
jgi:hypothetical protein